MAFIAVMFLSLLAAALSASAQSTCTTLQPVFELPLDGTSTIYGSTVTTTSSVDCGGCELVVSTFRAIISTPVPTPTTTTTTKAATTSATFVCAPTETSVSTSSSTSVITASATSTPTANPIPPVSPKVQEFIDELSTAILYAELFSNAGDQEELCSLIQPSSLDEIRGGLAINGTAVQNEICALGAIQFANPSLFDSVVEENQIAVSYLATALFAVQVAGGYAGGSNLATLCGEIDASLIDNIFINFNPDVGTAMKDYVCGAASASATSASASCAATAHTTSPPYPQNTTTPASPCSSPTGYANTVVPAPSALATANFQVAPSFTSAHSIFDVTNTDITLSEASIATDCLDRCVAYRPPNSTTGPCRSFFVNIGRPIPPTGLGGPIQWFCVAFDASLADDGVDYVPVDVAGSYRHGLGVNRVCNGTYRAY